jgi:tetratricopeptide (TPR) repeat protein
MMSAHWTSILGALSLLSGCAGTHYEAHTARDEPRETLTQGQLTEVATVLDKRGDVVRAEQYWRLALDNGADAETVLPQLIASFVRDRQYRLALQHAEDYLRAHPNAHTLRLLTGAIHEALGNYSGAVEQYQIVAEHQSERPDVHYVLGAALLKQGISRSEADACFRRYLDLAPHGRYAEQARALLLKEAHASLR